ncbi:recombinase family protein [Nocardia abscessus]|uniref:recombinase family protein n=1 Tax=Nocardia abscessus TaxID=120957 RepID=UPI002B4B466C|nr:recombinase family protein [Nocardia abscessus]
MHWLQLESYGRFSSARRAEQDLGKILPTPSRRAGYDRHSDPTLRRDLLHARLSRPFRSVRHMTELAATFDERGIALVVLEQGIDTTIPAGGSCSTSLPPWTR